MITVKEIRGRKQLKRFVKFAIDLYKGNDCYVPPIISDEVNNLDARHNPSLWFCDSVFFMAINDMGKPVGRIAGFINPRYNQKTGHRLCRFGYIDFINDLEVSKALLDAVAAWGREHGMDSLAGPLGMTDLDYEGTLTEGFDQLSTMSTIYNYPYYVDHFAAYGMEVDAQWNEYVIPIPDQLTDKHKQVAAFVRSRYGLRSFSETSRTRLREKWGHKIFELLNEAYSPLYCVSELDDNQIQYYIDLYLPLLRLDCIRLVTDRDDNLIGFAITCPSMSSALQKAKGRMLPLGWYHLYKAMHKRGGTDIWDLMLIAVRPDYQGKGVTSLIFTDLIEVGHRNGYRYVSAYPQLVDNTKVQDQWKYFDYEINRRRATFKCRI